MRIAVTGTAGQVVTSLFERGKAGGHEVIAIGRPDLDWPIPPRSSARWRRRSPT